MPPALGCRLVGFLRFGSVFENALRVLARWFLDASFQAISLELSFYYDFRNECAHFGCLRLLSGTPDASILGLGNHFGSLGAGHSGGPREQQSGHLAVWNRSLIGFR